MTVFVETARLRFRRLTPDDAANLFELDADPEVMRYLTGGAGTPLELIESKVLPAMLHAYDSHGGLGWWAAEAAVSGEFLGWFGLHPPDDAAPSDLELGYRLRRAAWGKGLATEGSRALLDRAFRDFGAARVFARTYEANIASRRVMEKLGMRFVRAFHVVSPESGTYDASSAEVFDGDDVEYAIERSGWERLARHNVA